MDPWGNDPDRTTRKEAPVADDDRHITIRTEDNEFVHPGERVYDYYNMKPGVIVVGSTDDHARPGDNIDIRVHIWFYVLHDDGTRDLLNGERICSIEYAKRRGFKGV